MTNELSSVKNALKILRSFTMEQPKKGVLDISRELNISKSSVHRILQTLASEGFVKKSNDCSKYELGISVIELNSIYLRHLDLYEESYENLMSLSQKTGETCHLAILKDYHIVYLNKVELAPSSNVQSHVGHHNHIHCTGTGKVLLAFSEPEVIQYVLEKGLEKVTEKTITDPAVLLEELAQIRQQGYGIVQGEYKEQMTSIAVPIRNYRGQVIAAINLVGLTSRFTEDRTKYIVQLLREESEAISKKMGHVKE